MPEQARIQRILDLKQRADENRDAQEPGDAANRRCEPGQMDQAAARLRQSLYRRRITAGIRLKSMKQIAKRKNSLQPQIDTDRINNGVVGDNRGEETLP